MTKCVCVECQGGDGCVAESSTAVALGKDYPEGRAYFNSIYGLYTGCFIKVYV